MHKWRVSTWGKEISLEYGKGLRGYANGTGDIRVFGTNGPVGWTAVPLADGPGVILGRKGAYRGVHYSPDPFFVIDTAYYAVPKAPLNMRWLYYAIIFHELGKIDDGSPIPSTTRAAVYPRELRVPSLEEQAAIAAVLGSLDDKIEQNRRTGRALEKLARAIFRAWFVDFEPVHAKAAGATSFPSMPQDVFDELPEAFSESAAGPVPDGWQVKTIGDVVSIKGGATPSTKDPAYWDGGSHFWATPKDMSRLSEPVLLRTERRITDQGLERNSSGLLPVGTVLLSSRAPVGYLAIAGVPTAINQGFIAMVCDGPLPPTYVLQWTSSVMDQIKARASGTTFLEISKSNFRPIPVTVPPKDSVTAFQRLSDPLFDALVANVRESRKLAELRDYLLPKLLSGQVRVRDAEKWADAPEAFDVAEQEAHTARTSVSVQCNLTAASDAHDGLGDADDEPAADTRGGGVAVAEADDESPNIAGRSSVPIESWSTKEVMAAFRKAARNRGAMTREELLKRAALQLGYQRLGSAIRERLKNHLRAALRRHIIAADGPELVVAETTSMGDYELDELVDVLRSVMRKGQAMPREDVIRAVASHLGFTRLVDSVQAPIKSAINAGIRRGILQYDRNTLWRVV